MLGLLTGNIQLGAELKLRHFGSVEIFKFGGFADDNEDRDHIAAAAFERGRRVLGKNLRPEEIVVIGDTPFDVRCGKFIGAKVLAVATGGATLEELKKAQTRLGGGRFDATQRAGNLREVYRRGSDGSPMNPPLKFNGSGTAAAAMPAATGDIGASWPPRNRRR